MKDGPMPSLADPRQPVPRYQKVVAVFILLWLILFGSVDLEYHFAPWETSYRQGALSVMHDEIASLPTVDDVTGYAPIVSEDSPSIQMQYPRTRTCADVLAHYRQMVPLCGWDYVGPDPTLAGDDYRETLRGYYLTLIVNCQTDTKSTPSSGSSAISSD
jgi:hypothetical protein